jgi:hypothetical protein
MFVNMIYAICLSSRPRQVGRMFLKYAATAAHSWKNELCVVIYKV